jgi:prevent-host-death family protein
MIAIRQQTQRVRELPDGLHAEDYTKDCRKCKFVYTSPDRSAATARGRAGELSSFTQLCGARIWSRREASALSGDEYQTEHSLVQCTPGAVTMATVINIHEAKTHLSRIVEEVAAGREVIIAKAGRRVAKLVPLEPVGRPKKLGGLKGRVRVPDDFNALLDARVLAAFEGRS